MPYQMTHMMLHNKPINGPSSPVHGDTVILSETTLMRISGNVFINFDKFHVTGFKTTARLGEGCKNPTCVSPCEIVCYILVLNLGEKALYLITFMFGRHIYPERLTNIKLRALLKGPKVALNSRPPDQKS